MKTREELIEVMALADRGSTREETARYILTAIEAAGCVVVPEEATEEMTRTYDDANWSEECCSCQPIWGDMLAASPFRPR